MRQQTSTSAAPAEAAAAAVGPSASPGAAAATGDLEDSSAAVPLVPVHALAGASVATEASLAALG